MQSAQHLNGYKNVFVTSIPLLILPLPSSDLTKPFIAVSQQKEVQQQQQIAEMNWKAEKERRLNF